MDKPSVQLAQDLAETCPNCRAPVAPVVTEQTTQTLLMAAYRCVMCRTDFTSVWQQGYVRQNQPELPYPNSPITGDIMPSNPYGISSVPATTHANAPDGVCQSCLAQPGTPHALACPYA